VDVDSVWLVARIGNDGDQATFSNSTEGIAGLAAFCQSQQVELVAMEASGGYEQQPFLQLSGGGVPVAILNPRAVRRFAEAMGLVEKTDAIDSGIIAWFAAVKRCRPSPPPTADQQQRRGLVTRLRQLTEVRVAQRNQRRLISNPAVLASIDELLALVQRQIEQLEEQIHAQIAADPLWRELDQAFRSIKGVADRTVARLMAEMPEIGTLPNKAISKLAGVAPLARDSGKRQGKRITRGGRASVREILFIVASVVGRYEPDFQAFQQRLSAAGKPPKVIRIALAHKLLVRLNAKARQVRQQMAATTALTAPAVP
jgi:transposase